MAQGRRGMDDPLVDFAAMDRNFVGGPKPSFTRSPWTSSTMTSMSWPIFMASFSFRDSTSMMFPPWVLSKRTIPFSKFTGNNYEFHGDSVHRVIFDERNLLHKFFLTA